MAFKPLQNFAPKEILLANIVVWLVIMTWPLASGHFLPETWAPKQRPGNKLIEAQNIKVPVTFYENVVNIRMSPQRVIS